MWKLIRLLLLLSALSGLSFSAHAVRCQVTIGEQTNAVINLPDIVPSPGLGGSSMLSLPLGLRCGRFTGPISGDGDVGRNGKICLTLNTGTGGQSGGSRLLAPIGNPANRPSIPFAMYQDFRGLPWSWPANGFGTAMFFFYEITYSATSIDSNYSAWTPYPDYETVSATINVPDSFSLIPGEYSSHLNGSVYAVARTFFGDCENVLRGEPFSITVNVEVKSKCKIVTTSTGIRDLNFGTQSSLSSAIDASTAFGVQCTKTTPYQVGLDLGQHASGNHRRMRRQSGTEYIRYELYQDPGRTVTWGNTPTAPADTVAGTGTGLVQNYTVHGRVPAGQNPFSGDYLDRVTVTVWY